MKVQQEATRVHALMEVVGALLEEGRVKEAEAVIAGYALCALAALEQGTLSAEDAGRAFVTMDFYLNNETSASFSEELADVIQEGECLHHYGEPDAEASGLRAEFLRQRAVAILSA